MRLPFVGRVIYLTLILLISWLVFRSNLHDLVKATFLTMPLMVILVMMGMVLYLHSKWLIVGIGAVVIGTVNLTSRTCIAIMNQLI